MTAYQPKRTKGRRPQAIRFRIKSVDRAEIERIDTTDAVAQMVMAGLLVASGLIAVLGIGWVNAAVLGVPQ